MNNEHAPHHPRHEPLDLAVTLHKSVVATPPDPSPDVARVAAMFGLGVDATREITVLPRCTFTLRGARLVFVTGPSGSGKSTLLRCLADTLETRGDASTCDFHALPALPDRPLVDTLPVDALEDRLRLLSIAGLGDAPVMLRRPSELSDGQRYRLRLAHAMALTEADPRPELRVLLADEFGATLDRRTAANVAAQLRKWVRRQPGVCFVCATTHDDLLEPLEPDVLIEVPLGEAVHVYQRTVAPEGSAS
ncbi:MAG: AAA family ATPase [Phycisphaeraceae bacterium]